MMARLRRAALVGLSAWIAWTAGEATAGPARYDAETRSMRFTYTYASLTPGQFGDAAIGAPQKPSSEQDAIVRTVVLKVSDALSKATGGRLKISALDLVPDARRADVVISLTGDPGRGGWAIAGAIEGRPGQIGLYYQVLAAEWEQDYVLTAAHEVCHYVFGLVDEYNFPRGCPLQNPGGPGCLMDNYLSQGSRHGWYGRFCAHDHVIDNSQRNSCQAIVDKFFADRNVTSAADEGQTEQAAAAGVAVSTRQSKLDNIVRATIGKVREEVEATNESKKPGTALASATSSRIKSLAQNFLKDQLMANGVNLESDEMRDVIESVLKQAGALISVAVPPQFQPIENLIAKFAASRAKELKEKEPKGSEKTLRGKLVRDILAFLSGMGGASAPKVGNAPSSEDRQYLDFMAAQALAQVEQKRADQELYDAALTHIKLDRETAGTILDIATQVGVPGAENRLAALGEIDADLRTYLPGRTASTGFGRRRTIIIDPDPLDPRKDFVVTQSGIYRYVDLRDQYVELFTKLIERAQIDLYATDFQKRRLQQRREFLAKPADERGTLERQRRIAELSDRDKARGQRESDLRVLINEVSTAVRENRIENIIFLVPPGGVPRDMISLFEGFRRQLIRKGDVRIDVILVADADVPFELRDITVGSGGSIVTITDVDEVGAVAQRLKNDQTSGSWVILPYQDEISPYYDKDRREVRWLRDDLKRAPIADEPIGVPYYNAWTKLEAVNRFFPGPEERINDGDKQGLGSLIGSGTPENSNALDLLANARVMPPAARRTLVDYIHQAIDPDEKTTDAAPDTLGSAEDPNGLLNELTYLNKLIIEYNQRTHDELGVALRYEILEHVIKSRTQFNEVKTFLNLALAAHEPYLPRDYDEDKLFKEIYEKPEKDVSPPGDQTQSGKTGTSKETQSTEFPAGGRPIPPADGSAPAAAKPDEAKRPAPQAGTPGAPPSPEAEIAEQLLELYKQYKNAKNDVKPPGDRTQLDQAGSTKGPESSKASPEGRPTPRVDGTPPAAVKPDEAKSPAPQAGVPQTPPSVEAETAKQEDKDVDSSESLKNLPVAPQDKSGFIAWARREIRRAGLSMAKLGNKEDVYKQIADHLKYMSDLKAKYRKRLYKAKSDTPDPTTESMVLERRIETSLSVLEELKKTYKNSPEMLAYLGLKIQEVRLRIVQDFLSHIEYDLGLSDRTLVFRRINRESQVRAAQLIQDRVFQIEGPDGVLRPVLPPADVVDSQGHDLRAKGRFRLPRFYADDVKFDPKQKSAEFELILGFSQPLPGVDADAIRDGKMERLPRLALYNDDGRLLNTPSLQLDRDVSSPTCLIYRFAPEFGEKGWYTGGLILNETMLRRLVGEKIHFTFSVASTRPNVRLNAALVQMPDDPELVPPPPRKGLVRTMDRRAKLEVQVYGGTSILGASISGVLHKIDSGNGTIEPIAQDFFDDGHTYGDLTPNDGVYTSIVSLDQITKGMEYRVFIQAESTSKSRNIAPEDPSKNDEARRKDAKARGDKTIREQPVEKVDTPQPEPAIQFQRATSIQIRVEP